MSLPHRPEDAIQDLIDAKQWKQALNLCEKKVKKGDKSDLTLIRRIGILLELPDNARHQQAFKELDSILQRSPPVTEIKALSCLDYFSSRIGDQEPRLRQCWERAAHCRPQDEGLHATWYQTKFELGDIRAMQKASMVWMKNFPKKREPYFLYIVTTYSLAGDSANSESERGLFQTLAYKCISKAAADVPQDDGESPARALQTEEECLLLLRIYREQGKYQEAVSILEDTRIGLSQIVNNSWEITRQKIEVFELCKKWESEWEMCQRILEDSRQEISHAPVRPRKYSFGKLGDDWKIWDGLLTATGNICSEENTALTEGVIGSFVNRQPVSRNARIALLKFCCNEVSSARKDQDTLLLKCQEYFLGFSTKVICFHDLEPYISCLERSKQERLVLKTAEIARNFKSSIDDTESTRVLWITSEINSLKLEYHLVISRDDSLAQEDLLYEFVNSCLRLYRISLDLGLHLTQSDRKPGDDAAILAAMGLIRLSKIGPKNLLLRSVIVLENLLVHSKHNFDALLILVRLYMFLGAGTLAMERYHRLLVKNLQHATISWVLYTRISTIHPYPARSPNALFTMDPLDEIGVATSWFSLARDLNHKSIRTIQTHGHWNMFIDGLATNDYVANSISKYLLLVERERIRRLRSLSHDVEGQAATYVPRRTTETRDRTPFPNYEASGQPTFEEILPFVGSMHDNINARPNDKWLAQQLSAMRLWEALHNHGASSLSKSEILSMKEASGSEHNPSTSDELGVGNIIHVLEELFTVFFVKPQDYKIESVGNFVTGMIQTLEDWMTASAKNLTSNLESGLNVSARLKLGMAIPLWSYYHTLYLHLELCLFMIPTLDYVLCENRKMAYVDIGLLETTIGRLKEAYTKLYKDVRRFTNDMRDSLRGESISDQLLEEILGPSTDVASKSLQDLMPRAEVKAICVNLQQSWIEGLDGVMRTKVM